jgi:hypothetical protein
MHDDLTFDAFEARFADAYGRYLEAAPVEVDAVQVAAAAVADAARRRSLLERLARPAWLPQVPRRVLVVATAALLLLALGASLLLVGSLVNPPPLGGSSHLYLTNGAYDCQDAVRFDVASGESETVVDCVDRLRIAPDGLRAAARGTGGIEIIDLADGTATPMESAPGAFTTAAAWSPRSTWLHWVSCETGDSEGCRGFIGQPGSAATNEIPEGESGYNGSFTWSADESAFLLWQNEEVLAGTGAGAALVQVPGLFSLPLAVSPDGLLVAVTEGRNLPGGELVQSDLSLRSLTDTVGTRVTDNPEGSFVTCAAWSPDASRIAVSVTHRGTSAAPVAEPTAELVVVTPTGTLEQRWPIPAATLDCNVLLGRSWSITWAADGARVLLIPNAIDEVPALDPMVVTLATGEVLSLDGLERPELSPDGQSVAALGNVDSSNPDATDAPATVEIIDLVSGTQRSLGPVTIGPWSVLVWAP